MHKPRARRGDRSTGPVEEIASHGSERLLHRTAGTAQSSLIDNVRYQRQVLHLHRLGPRAVAEFLTEIGKQADCAPAIFDLLTEYQDRLTPELIRQAGGDRFARIPLLLVPR